MDKTKLILGSGEVYFNRFNSGTLSGDNERYIGNTTEFDVVRTVGFSESRKSVRGVKLKNNKSLTTEDVTFSFRTDNMTTDNIADWMGGEVSTKNVGGRAAQSETFVLVPGRFYQLGLALYPGIGVSDIFGMSIKVNGNFVTDFYMDEVSGRFGVPMSRTDLIGDTATVEYEVRSNKSTIIKASAMNVRGSLRFISRNLGDGQMNYFFPHVLLSPTDRMKLKDADWQSLAFEGESLEPYITYAPVSHGRSPGEQALINEGINPTGFVVIEGVLNDALIGG